jgi:hypothetical protein
LSRLLSMLLTYYRRQSSYDSMYCYWSDVRPSMNLIGTHLHKRHCLSLIKITQCNVTQHPCEIWSDDRVRGQVLCPQNCNVDIRYNWGSCWWSATYLLGAHSNILLDGGFRLITARASQLSPTWTKNGPLSHH